jgi:hypothetical protein
MTHLTLTSRPSRADGLTVVQDVEDSAVLVATPERPAYRLNDTALALWELCDGSTSVAEMVGAASVVFAADPTNLQRDVLDALQELLHDGLIVDTPR